MYDYKEVYVIDFTNVKYYFEMHEVIQKELDFPDYYGYNWDAFWDCMTDMILDDPVHIQIIGLENIEKRFQESEKLLELLHRVKHHYDDEFVDTVFIEIIDENGNVMVVE